MFAIATCFFAFANRHVVELSPVLWYNILKQKKVGSDFMGNFTIISNEEKYKRIGLNVAFYRKIKGLTQVQLAEKVGISRTHISNIEAPNMVTPVSMELVFNLSDVLEIPVSALFKFD